MKSLSFNEAMVLAWMAGRKTVTRQVAGKIIRSPYRPGETVYIKETWAHWFDHNKAHWFDHDKIDKVFYKAEVSDLTTGEKMLGWKWRSPRFMPEWAARSHARIISVRLERVQEITEKEAKAEGCENNVRFIYDGMGGPIDYNGRHAIEQFEELWETLYPGSWSRNDWVFRIELEKLP